MQEYYIRRVGDEEASGPFDVEQMMSLVETGKLDQTAFYYDVETEEWQEIAANQELTDQLYPKKQKLTLQAVKEPEPVPPPPSETPKDRAKADQKEETIAAATKQSVSIHAMLAQAEGREGDDPKGLSPVEKRARAAFIGLRFSMLLLLGSAACYGYLEWSLVQSANALYMMKNPYLIVAAIDVVFGFLLLLQVTEVYGLVRFRAALGAGFLGILLLASGDVEFALANALLSVGLYLCTASLTLRKVIPACLIGGIGLAGMIILILLPDII